MTCAWSDGWVADEVTSPAADDPRLSQVVLVVVGRCRVTSGSGSVCANGITVLGPDGRKWGVFFNRSDGGMKVVPCR